jgi:kynurenine formamidase
MPFCSRFRCLRYLIAVLLCANAAAALALEPDAGYRLIDLTHAYNEETVFWPTSPTRFELETLSEGETDGGWYYSAYSVCTPEHGGTHLDAPVHFHETGKATDELPLQNLVAPGVVIDVAQQAAKDRDYRLTVADVNDFESRHGRIEAGTIVLMRTGWSRHWPDAKKYLGDDTPGDASKLSFPSFGLEAARLLVQQRGVVLLGVDTASIDYGRSTDFPVHRMAGAHDVGGLENLTGLDALPARGFLLLALPMKIEGGSGGPARVIAMIPE